MDPADGMLLASVQTALENPFRDPVRVVGQLMPRSLARQIERNLLRLRVAERRSCRDAGESVQQTSACEPDAHLFARSDLSFHAAEVVGG